MVTFTDEGGCTVTETSEFMKAGREGFCCNALALVTRNGHACTKILETDKMR